MNKISKLIIICISLFMFTGYINASSIRYESNNYESYITNGAIKLFDGETEEDDKQTSDGTNAGTISEDEMTCEDILGPNLQKILKLFITILRVAGMAIIIVSGSISALQAVGNPDKMKEFQKKMISMGIILIVIVLLPTLINVIASIFGFEKCI